MSFEEIKKQLEMNGQKIISTSEYLQLKKDAENAEHRIVDLEDLISTIKTNRNKYQKIIEEAKKTLDECIEFWRSKKSFETIADKKFMAECYIDAYQSMRKNIFGEILEAKK